MTILPEHTPPLQSRLPKVGTTIFTVMSALAAEKGAVNLGQGFPDFDCDPRLVDAVAAAMRRGLNQYPPMPGPGKMMFECVGRTRIASMTFLRSTPLRSAKSDHSSRNASVVAR